MDIDRPEVIEQARDLLDRYEVALMANDAATLDSIFWADPRTVRFGITEVLFGHDAIRAFRATIRAYAPRVQRAVHITTFGDDLAVTNLLYERTGSGRTSGQRGRETKIMARFPDGWHVVSAHVSLLAEADPGTQRV